MITQNNCDFLNWGGHNNTFLMRPLYQPATTEHLFNSQSVYRSQFIKHRVKKIEHVYRGDQQRQISNIMLYNKSSYAHNYQPKTGCKLENFKIPELRLAALKDAPRNT